MSSTSKWENERAFYQSLSNSHGASEVLYLTILCFFACAVRHYEVVYLIHEKHEEEVAAVNEKVQGNPLLYMYIFFLTIHDPLMPSNHFNSFPILGVMSSYSSYFKNG